MCLLGINIDSKNWPYLTWPWPNFRKEWTLMMSKRPNDRHCWYLDAKLTRNHVFARHAWDLFLWSNHIRRFITKNAKCLKIPLKWSFEEKGNKTPKRRKIKRELRNMCMLTLQGHVQILTPDQSRVRSRGDPMRQCCESIDEDVLVWKTLGSSPAFMFEWWDKCF